MLTQAIDILAKSGIETAKLDAELLLAQVLHCTREEILMRPRALTPQEQREFEAAIARRATREPMAHILGRREFYGREFIVTKDVLDPRPDSETLIEAVLKKIPNPQSPIAMIDFGTGSGCLLLTLLVELPNTKGLGVDISVEAIEIAKRNAALLGVTDRVTWVAGDMRNYCGFQATYDVIISNPPYIATSEIAGLAPEVADFEPKLALDGGESGLDCYLKLAKQLTRLLKPDGFVALEIGSTQAGDVSRILRDEGFKISAVHKDLGGNDRVIIANI